MMKSTTQKGFTIVEMMIGMSVGLLVILVTMSVYVSTLSSSRDILAASKLNQEINTLMNVMVNDIRRAGYWGNGGGNADYEAPQDNPFNQMNDTALEVIEDMTIPQVKIPAIDMVDGTNDGGECIVFAYDLDHGDTATGDGVAPDDVDTNEITGFRLNRDADGDGVADDGVVQMRQVVDVPSGGVGDDCSDQGGNATWVDLTDGRLVNVTTLNFSLENSACINNREWDTVDTDADGTVDDADEINCYDDDAANNTPAAGSITVETRQVTITIGAELANNDEISILTSQDVRVRNDLVRVR